MSSRYGHSEEVNTGYLLDLSDSEDTVETSQTQRQGTPSNSPRVVAGSKTTNDTTDYPDAEEDRPSNPGSVSGVQDFHRKSVETTYHFDVARPRFLAWPSLVSNPDRGSSGRVFEPAAMAAKASSGARGNEGNLSDPTKSRVSLSFFGLGRSKNKEDEDDTSVALPLDEPDSNARYEDSDSENGAEADLLAMQEAWDKYYKSKGFMQASGKGISTKELQTKAKETASSIAATTKEATGKVRELTGVAVEKAKPGMEAALQKTKDVGTKVKVGSTQVVKKVSEIEKPDASQIAGKASGWWFKRTVLSGSAGDGGSGKPAVKNSTPNTLPKPPAKQVKDGASTTGGWFGFWGKKAQYGGASEVKPEAGAKKDGEEYSDNKQKQENAGAAKATTANDLEHTGDNDSKYISAQEIEQRYLSGYPATASLVATHAFGTDDPTGSPWDKTEETSTVSDQRQDDMVPAMYAHEGGHRRDRSHADEEACMQSQSGNAVAMGGLWGEFEDAWADTPANPCHRHYYASVLTQGWQAGENGSDNSNGRANSNYNSSSGDDEDSDGGSASPSEDRAPCPGDGHVTSSQHSHNTLRRSHEKREDSPPVSKYQVKIEEGDRGNDQLDQAGDSAANSVAITSVAGLGTSLDNLELNNPWS